MSKFYASKLAAVRHAVNYIGPDWEKSHILFPIDLPDGKTYYTLAAKIASNDSKPSSRRSSSAERQSAVSSFIPRSRIKGATKRVWDIADLMKGKGRREILDECRRQGIATGTAATQYQRWRATNK